MLLKSLRRTFTRWRRKVFVLCCLVLFAFNVGFIYYRVDYSMFNRGHNKQIVHEENSYGGIPQTTENYNLIEDDTYTIQCNLTSSSYSLKAVQRATTESCRKKLTKIGCILQQGGHLHPTILPRQCPLRNPGGEGYWLGCYKDSPNNRIFKTALYSLNEENSPDACMAACLRIGAEAAGMESGTECFCGSKANLVNVETVPEEKCDEFDCPANKQETCGGKEALSVYKTGLGSITNVAVAYVPTNEAKEPKEGSVRVAFLLQFNGRAVRQTKRLLKLIYRQEHFYYVHVDMRQDYMYREMLKLESILPNFRVKRKRFASMWGGISLLDMMLDAGADLLKTDWKFDYVLNLSESDLPLMNVEEVVALLNKYRGVNFLKNHGNVTARFIKKQGMDKLFYECDNHMWRVGDRKMPDGIRFDGGSDWFVLHRTFMEYAALSEDKLVVGLKLMYKYALLPAESFFHTLAANSVFCVKTTNTNLKFANWRRKQGCKCQYKHIVDWCGCSPSVFVSSDANEKLKRPLIEKKLYYFARKFESIIDQKIINELDIRLRDSSTRLQKATKVAYDSYWQNDFDISDSGSNKDSRLMLFQSLMRLGVQHSMSCSGCSTKGPISVNVFRSEDEFKGFTVLFNVDCVEVNLTSEVLVYPVQNFTKYIYAHFLADNLRSMQVGTNFDLKEEIFRNYVGFVDESSTPVLRMEYARDDLVDSDGKKFKVVVVWIDPQGKDRKTQTITLQSPTGIENVKLNLNSNLNVGEWKVVIKIDKVTFGEVAFIVLPTLTNMDQIKRDLLDEMVGKFYSFRGFCFSNLKQAEKRCTSKNKLTVCKDTYWSSLSPDPKSEITGVDNRHGVLVP